MITGETVSVDVLGSHASRHCRGVLSDSRLRNRTGNRGGNPTGNAEEVQHVLNYHDEHDARKRLSEASNRGHHEGNDGKNVNLSHKRQQEANKQRNENGKNVVKPVLNEIGNNGILAKEALRTCLLVDETNDEAHEQSSEHTAGAKLVHIKEHAALNSLGIHAHHVNADARKAGNHGTIALALLNRNVMRDDKGYEQADETKGVGVQG